jgi:integrase
MYDTINAEYESYYGMNDNRRKSVNPKVNQSTIDPDNETTTVSNFLSEWIRFKENNIRPKTSQDYYRLLDKYVYPGFIGIYMKDLDTRSMNFFYRNLVDQQVGFRTVRYLNSILKVAFKDAISQGIISSNPTDGVILPRWTKKEMHALDQNEVQRFLKIAKDSRFFYVYYLAILTGMRLGELMGLRWSDVDFQNQVISISRQAQAIKGKGIIFSEPKTRSGIRKIKVQPNTIEALIQQKEKILEMKNIAHHKWMDNDLVFPSTIGTPMVSYHLRKDFFRLLSLAGLPRIRFHDLRHTAATLMINHGVPIIVISKMLGHSKPSVTLDFYGHCSVAMQDEASKIMDSVMNNNA